MITNHIVFLLIKTKHQTYRLQTDLLIFKSPNVFLKLKIPNMMCDDTNTNFSPIKPRSNYMTDTQEEAVWCAAIVDLTE